MNKRNIVLDKYGISGARYKELCGFCEQYPEWKAKLRHKTNCVKSVEITDMPLMRTNSDQTGNLAILRFDLEEKCRLIEETAKMASPDLDKYIIASVCDRLPLSYLQMMMDMPCSRATFYDIRRYFFYLLDQNKSI
jgi:hypothetical protein